MTTKMSIKDLTNSLKNKSSRSLQAEEAPQKKEATESKEVEIQPVLTESTGKEDKKDRKKTKNHSSLKEEFEKVNAISDYDLSAVVHIDKDIHEVLTKLKYATKLKIGRYISYKMEIVIRENLEEISEILNNSNKNKFLD